jgi:hypothetical protein
VINTADPLLNDDQTEARVRQAGASKLNAGGHHVDTARADQPQLPDGRAESESSKT